MAHSLDIPSLSGKRLLILDGTRIACEIVNQAKRMGVHTAVTDYNPPEQAPAKLLADEYFMVSITDVDEVVALIQRERFDGVVAGYSDLMLPYYAEICEKTGLPCYGTKELFKTFTDKLKYKSLCFENDVPTIRGYDLAAFESEKLTDVCFPVMVKPADGSGSRGVTICRSAGEVLSAAQVACAFSPSDDVLIEQYINGEEATVFWVFQDGEYYVSAMADRHVKQNEGSPLPLPVAYSYPSRHLGSYEQDIAPNVRKMLSSAGVRNGMMFMQGLIDDGVFRVYDIGFRLTGTQEYRLLEHISDYNPLAMLISFALTGSMGEPALSRKARAAFDGYAYNVSLLMRPGTISHFEGITEVEDFPGVISVVKAHVEGETLPPEAQGQLRQITVRVQGIADSTASMLEAIRYAAQTLKVIGASGEDLTLPGYPFQRLEDGE